MTAPFHFLRAALLLAVAIAPMQGAWADSLQGITVPGTPPAAAPSAAIGSKPVVRPKAFVDVDAAGRAPFQFTTQLQFSSGFVPVPIPAGMRLVVDHIAITGAAASAGGPILPYAYLNVTQTVSGSANFAYPLTQSPILPTQYYYSTQATLYADSMSVAVAFAGYTPSFLIENVSISGHLINPTAP